MEPRTKIDFLVSSLEQALYNSTQRHELPRGWSVKTYYRGNGNPYYIFVAPDGSRHRSYSRAKEAIRNANRFKYAKTIPFVYR